MKPGSSTYEDLKQEIREIEVDLNYCQYYPSFEEYQPLARAKVGRPESINGKDAKAGNIGRPALIRNLVRQCMADGSLQDLKDGRLENSIREKLSAAPIAQVNRAGSELTIDDIVNIKADAQSKVRSVQPDYNIKPEMSTILEPPSQEYREDSESDAGILINLQDKRQESPLSESELQEIGRNEQRISHLPDHTSDCEAESESESESEGDDSDIGGHSESEDGDAMMDYSNSDHVSAAMDGDRTQLNARHSNSEVRVLSELSPEDLNAQLRYFHVAKNPKDVDRGTPVRCLVCAQAGHMAEACELLTCNACGAYNQHITTNCPQKAKCPKCREQGHDRANCPYKLKSMAQSEVVCDRCQQIGHTEEHCELLWRTSGCPWESELANQTIRLGCYECGKKGHLGNDCPTRRPGKSMGTSTWSLNGKAEISIKPHGEISIRGKAQQQPITIKDSDDERTSFFGPKIPAPARKSQIRISTGPKQTFGDHRPGSFTPINEPYRNDRPRESQYTDYRDDRRGGGQLHGGGGYSDNRDGQQYNNYRPSNRRSMSPQYRDRGGDYRGDRYQPPVPLCPSQDRRSAGGANVYRPMPSSAQNAWVRHRM